MPQVSIPIYAETAKQESDTKNKSTENTDLDVANDYLVNNILKNSSGYPVYTAMKNGLYKVEINVSPKISIWDDKEQQYFEIPNPNSIYTETSTGTYEMTIQFWAIQRKLIEEYKYSCSNLVSNKFTIRW